MAEKKQTVKKSMTLQDPRQAEFLQLYLSPGTKYFNNALQSGLKAGYTQEYSENILQFDLKWLADGISELMGKPTDKKNLVAKAKRVLDRSLDSKDERISQDTAKFIAKTDIEFSNKSELTVKLPTPILSGNSNKNITKEIIDVEES